MGKTVAILQSNYIPWKGYFDLINMVDEFILYDDAQYTRRDWRNRNKIMTRNGVEWLTIPVEVKGKYHQAIKDTRISEPDWNKRHWATLLHTYGKVRYFSEYRSLFEPLYLECAEERLSRINHRFLVAICNLLGVRTRISWSMDYTLVEGRSERLLSICQQAGATRYISGPAARAYLDEELFRRAQVEVEWMDYSGYPEYQQLHEPFEHGVSILDLLFHQGPQATAFMKSFRSQAQAARSA
ncbi:MAG TPA: WbqC family protein [bacterium]|nr:WbqC family protein [bacterium]